MKLHYIPLVFVAITSLCFVACQNSNSQEPQSTASSDMFLDHQIVEASCGQCQFGIGERGCDLAIRLDGNSYFVDGSAIDDHGDAHAHDGFCEAIRKAEVTGEIINDRFIAQHFKLVD